MRCRGAAAPHDRDDRAAIRAMVDGVRAAHAAGMRPEVDRWSGDWRAADLPYAIDCPGLTVRDLGQAFAEEFQGRMLWCRENCQGAFSVEPIRRPEDGRDTGRRFRFAAPDDAAMFRVSWC
jgi:hypothetical protein